MHAAPHHALTVDVEEWFHVCGVNALSAPYWPSLPSRVVDNTRWLLDLFERTGTHATFFVLGYVAERYPRLVERIIRDGHEVGSHGHMHDRVYDLAPETFAADVDRSLAALAACGATRIRGFRAPEWSINDRSMWALEVLARRGFTFDSSMAPLRIIGNTAFPRSRHRRTTIAGDLIECPPAVARRFGQQIPFGGGWGLRMSQPERFLRDLDVRAEAGDSAVIWVHPWEIDDAPPHAPMPRAQRFAHYFRLSGFRSRFERIVSGGAFGPLGPLALEPAAA
ncbi:MAG: polysaccharide deacetylase family protein [Acidobacteriota bacterium]